ncbi:hypothetical protein [Sulfitobacter sp. SK012]|uniref:hypothetical protein n=1 Tax=Sulfitobacter sp. SK012 TaxID=1389005 RepID=UPI0013B474E6|nr:hypothetical protein [Sulfitobacter sp. SK012]
MSFSETYKEQRTLARMGRARFARILGRSIGIVLVLGFMVTMRTQPEFRALVLDNAINLTARVMGLTIPTEEVARVAASSLPQSRTKINRPVVEAPPQY